MEITCRIKTQIPGTVSNLLVMGRYKQLVAELYIEPKQEQILGSFLERDPENQVAIEKDGQNNPPGEKVVILVSLLLKYEQISNFVQIVDFEQEIVCWFCIEKTSTFEFKIGYIMRYVYERSMLCCSMLSVNKIYL